MTRWLFPQDRLVFRYGAPGTPLYSPQGETVTICTDSAGTTPASIQTPSGTPIDATLDIGSDCLIPEFLGPDGLTEVYAKNGAGTITPLYAQTGQIVQSLSGTYIPVGAKGAANGVASLGSDGKVPSGQLPTFATPPVTSVNTKIGAVVLNAADVGAYPASSGSALASRVTVVESGRLLSANNLSDVDDVPTTRTNLGLGTAALRNVGTTTGTAADGGDSRIVGAAQKSANLSDVADTPTARTNLGLGSAATKNVGTSTNQVAAGDDSRITGALQAEENLSDVTDVATARTSLGLGNTATWNVGTTTGTVAAGDDSRITGAAQKSANLSDIASASTARTSLGLGTAATQASSAFDASGAAAAAQAAAIAAIPGAATTVITETGYGQSSDTGSSSTYAREDHTHGSPALTTTAPATTEGIGQAAAVGTAFVPARADHVHPMAAAGVPAASTVTSTQTTGVASTFAASDHVHAREGFGATTAQTTFGAASATGTATTVAHSDHAHGTPTLPTSSTSTAGIIQLDGVAGDIRALGTQAAGSTGKAADAGHVHPTTNLVVTVAAPTGVAATDQANINAAIAALPGGGGIVQLQAGTYVVPAPGTASAGCISMNVNHSVLAGMGMGVTTIQLAPGSTGVTGIVRTPSGVANSSVTFRDFTIDGNGANQTGLPVIVGFYCGVTPNSTATDTDISVIRVEAMNCVGYGFDPHERTTRLYMLGCISHDNGLDGAHDGFTLDAQYDGTITGCVSYNNGRHGFNLVTASTNMTLVGCDSYGNSGSGYVLQNGAKYNSLVGCKAHGNTLEGILVNGVPQSGQQDNLPGAHNSVKACTVALSGTHGIHLVGTSYNHISGCTVRDSSQTTTNSSNQIYLNESGTNYSTYNTVENNDLAVSTGVTNLAKYGIAEKTSNEDFNFIFGNRSLGAFTAPLNLLGSTSSQLAAHNGVNEHPATAPYVQDTPSVHGLLEWTFPPSSAGNGAALTAGRLYLREITVQTGGVVTRVVANVTTLGSGLTASYAAIFDISGNQLAVSADISSQLTSVGSAALSISSVTLSPSQKVLVAILVGNSSTTPPSLARGATGSGAINYGLTTSSPLMVSTYSSGLTTMPNPITMGSTTASNSLDLWLSLAP